MSRYIEILSLPSLYVYTLSLYYCYLHIFENVPDYVHLCQVIHRLGAEAPKKSLVENYMVEIARNYHIDYQPDPTMFMVHFTLSR